MTELVRLFFWSSVVWGVTMVVTTSKLFARLRDSYPKACKQDPYVTWRNAFGTWMNCPMCMAAWVGAAFALLGFRPVVWETMWTRPGWLPTDIYYALTVFSAAVSGSATSWSWRVVLAKLGSREL